MADRGRHEKKIDTVHWTGFQATSLVQSAGAVGAIVLAAQHLPETLMRTRGELMVYKDSTAAPGELALISVGMILVPEGTGSTVLWSPFTDADAPWFWYESVHIGEEEMVTDVIDVPSLTGSRRVIDSKAMRKVRNREVQLVVENTTLASAMAVNTAVAGRFLSGS